VSSKTKAKKSVTITITIAIILFSCNTWDDYKTYQCPKCDRKKYIPFTCNPTLRTLFFEGVESKHIDFGDFLWKIYSNLGYCRKSEWNMGKYRKSGIRS
jgi:hypothetical protein